MSLYKELINGNKKLALVGLGYVGMPMAVAFANKGIKVIAVSYTHLTLPTKA